MSSGGGVVDFRHGVVVVGVLRSDRSVVIDIVVVVKASFQLQRVYTVKQPVFQLTVLSRIITNLLGPQISNENVKNIQKLTAYF